MAEAFGAESGLEAYERLLYDVMMQDHLLFTRSEQIERLWEVCAPVLDDPPEPLSYKKGSWGPDRGPRAPDGSGLAPS